MTDFVEVGLPSRLRSAALSRRREAAAFAPILVFSLFACTQAPVRKPVTLDPKVPAGRVEGRSFTGIRIPLEISAVEGWEASTTYPAFLLEHGYEKGGLDDTEVFLYNPRTQSSVQISFAPAGAYTVFDQEYIEALASLATGSMEHELEGTYGKGNYRVTHGKTTAVKLRGVPYAARNSSVYEAKGTRGENAWIYAFAEPFQIFILYEITGPDPEADRKAVEAILSTFRYTGMPSPPR